MFGLFSKKEPCPMQIKCIICREVNTTALPVSHIYYLHLICDVCREGILRLKETYLG